MKRGSFLFFFYATLAAGFGAVGSSFAFVLLAGLVPAHGVQRSLFGRRHFPEDVAVAETGHEDIYYRGSYIPTNIGAQKEKRFLQSVYGSQSPMLAKVTMGLMLGLFVFAGHRIPDTSWSLGTLLEMLAVVSIIPVAAFSQYLVPLFFSAAGVLLARQTEGFWPAVLIVVYGIGFCVTCAAHGFEENRIAEKTLREGTLAASNPWHAILKNAATAFGVFCAIYTAVDTVLPSHRPASEEALFAAADTVNHFSVKKALAGHVWTRLREKNRGSQADSTAGTAKAETPSAPGDGSLDLARQLAKNLPGPNGAGNPQPQNGITFDPSQKIYLPKPEFAGKFHGDDGSPDKLPSGSGTGDDSELAPPPIARGLEPNIHDGGTKKITQNDIDQERSQIKQAVNDMATAAKNLQAQGRQPSDFKPPRLQGPEQKEAGNGAADGHGGKARADSGPAAGAATSAAASAAGNEAANRAPVNSSGPPQEVSPNVPPEPPLMSEATLMALVTIFKFLFAAACAWSVYVYFTRSSKTGRRDRGPRLSSDQRVRLSSEIKDFARLRVKNRDGIIRGYQIFLKVMAAAQLPKEDYLPPADYAARLKRTWPRFDESFSIITDVFSDAFYGESNVAEQRISQYESALKRIMSAVVG